MNNNVQLHLCFDGIGRQIEVLDVKRISKETMRIMENRIFSNVVSYGELLECEKTEISITIWKRCKSQIWCGIPGC